MDILTSWISKHLQASNHCNTNQAHSHPPDRNNRAVCSVKEEGSAKPHNFPPDRIRIGKQKFEQMMQLG